MTKSFQEEQQARQTGIARSRALPRGPWPASTCWAVGALLVLVAWPVEAAWRDDYRRGLKALEAGKNQTAKAALEAALEENPQADASARTYGSRRGYFPDLYLGVLSYREKDLDAASRHLQRARLAGAASANAESARILQQHELLVANMRFVNAALNSPTSERPAADVAAEAILAREAAEQCGEPPRERQRGRPWYYHYILAGKLRESGDWMGSLQHLSQALARRDESGTFVRAHGMKYIRYRPWYDMGRAHAHLKNWQCAVDALELSTSVEAFGRGDGLDQRARSEYLAGARLKLSETTGASEH